MKTHTYSPEARARSADFQSALDERTREADCQSALRFGRGSGAFHCLSALLAVAAAVALFAACNNQDGHAGRQPAKTESTAKPDAGAAKCAKHDARKDWCFICDPALRDKGRLWCGEHACYEDRCWECHPELQDKQRPWCKEHSLYEDECFLCHPELKTKGKAGAQLPSDAPALMCKEHGVPEAECGICRPEMAGKLAPGQGVKVRLPSAQSATLAGVQTAAPEVGVMSDAVECLAEVSYDLNRLAQIAAPVGGIIQAVEADLGAQVEEGGTVAKIWSASVAEAVAKAVLTHQTLDRERRLRSQRVTSERDLQEAEATHRAACQQLRTLGFTEERIDQLSAKPGDSVLLEVRAPFAGEIVERSAVRGALVEAGKALFTVADRSRMWANLNLPETVLARVQAGQPVEVTVDALPGRTFSGKLTWIGPAVDERTRMARARAEVANPNGELRDKMFARARIITRQTADALLVPSSAIQRVGGKPLVFVKLANDLFEARGIELGARFNGQQEILAGLGVRDQIAVACGFALKSQLLISRLGASCTDD